MERAEITPRVVKVIMEELGAKEKDVVETADIQEDLGADSLDVVELVMHLEDEFKEDGLEVPDEDVRNLKTVGDVINYVHKQIG